MNYTEHIERNPKVMLGKPIIKGTRITVELIMRKLGDGYSIDELLIDYPNLNKTQLLAALQFAADMIASEENLESA